MTAPTPGGPTIRDSQHGPDDPQSAADTSKSERAFNAFSTASVGLEMGIAVAIGFGVGYYLDGRYDTAPTLTLIGLGLGVAAGFRALFRVARQAKRRDGESKGHHDTGDSP